MEKFELFWRQTLLLFLPCFVLSACMQSTYPLSMDSVAGVNVQPNAEQVNDFSLAEPAVQELIQATSSIQDCISSLNKTEETPRAVDAESAQQALTAFFSYLHAGEYEQAVDLYGGSYAIMQDHNPDIDPEDRAALLRNACKVNGAQCLEVRRATLRAGDSPAELQFAVEFANHDGSLFTTGPCCGEEVIKGEHQKEFIYTVRMECTGKYKVYDMPVYLP